MSIGISLFMAWKLIRNVYLFRLKCTFSNKPPSVTPINQSNEQTPIRPPPIAPDPSIIEMQKMVNNIFF